MEKDPKELLQQVHQGNRRALARTISMIENHDQLATHIPVCYENRVIKNN